MGNTKVGFIGLGKIGEPMAKRLLNNGWEVVSCAHVCRTAIEELKTLGLTEVACARDVASDVDVVITMVRDTGESHEVIFGERGVLAGMARGKILVIMSTIDPSFCKKAATQGAAKGVEVLDAPVSGFPFRAQSGTLALMVGGEPAVLERCRSVLENFGQIFHCGGAGMGMVTKLANQAVAIGTAALLLEACTLGRAYGVSEAHLMNVLKHASANSFMVQHWEAIADMWDHFVDVALKDMQICLDAAQAMNVDMPITSLARQHNNLRIPRTDELPLAP